MIILLKILVTSTEIYCPNSNRTLNYTIDCSLIVLSDKAEEDISISFRTGVFNNISLTSLLSSLFLNAISVKSINYVSRHRRTLFFGIDVPDVTIADETIPSSFSQSYETLITSTELKFDSKVIGFEFYAVNTGMAYVRVKVVSFKQPIKNKN